MTSSSSLTGRALVGETLLGNPPSRLPCGELGLDLTLVREAVGLPAGAAVPLDAERALVQRWHHDLVTVSFSHGWGAGEQPDEADARFRLSYWQRNSDLFVFALIDGPFSSLSKAWTWQDAVIRITRNDPEVKRVMADAVVEASEQLAVLAKAGADGIIIGEDIAFRRGPIIHPDHLRRLYFPYLTLLVVAAQDLGLPVVFHSDGNLWPIWEDLLRTGINGVQGLDPFSAMSLPLARSRSPESLCLWGNLDIGWLTREHDEAEVMRQLEDIVGPLRGTPTIFGTSSGLAPGLPLTMLDTLYRTVARFPWKKTQFSRIESAGTGL
ncbi:MAG: hypothetical protein D6775_09500 [Caldilineae bacterium]|nr:MAG: hypothetical protein D6775_09500 [Caldilineae bacterium]